MIKELLLTADTFTLLAHASFSMTSHTTNTLARCALASALACIMAPKSPGKYSSLLPRIVMVSSVTRARKSLQEDQFGFVSGVRQSDSRWIE